MISKMWISPTYEKENNEKRDSSTSFTDVTLSKVTLRTEKSKKKSKRRLLEKVAEETADNQADSLLFPSKANVLHREEISLNSGCVAKNNDDVKADEAVYKKRIRSAHIEIQAENDYLNAKEEEQIIETANDNSCRKHKKKKKHKYSEVNPEHENETIVPSSYYKESNKKDKPIKIKSTNKTEDVQSDVEESVVFCEVDRPVIKPKVGKPLKRKFSDSQSYSDNTVDHTIIGKNDSTHCSSKSLDISNQHNNHKKFKWKHKPNSKEPKNNSCNEDNNYDCKFEENEPLANFHSQESPEFSEYSSNTTPSNKNYVSFEMTGSLASPKKKKSFVSICDLPGSPNLNQSPGTKNQVTSKKSLISCNQPSSPDLNQSPSTKNQGNVTQNSQVVISNFSNISNKKPKKKRKRSSFLESDKHSTELNENLFCDVKEPNKSEKALVKSSQKYKCSMSSAGVFDENSTVVDQFNNDLNYKLSQNLPKTEAKEITLEINDELFCQKMTSTKEKVKKNKDKKCKAIYSSNDKILIVGQNEDVIAEDLYKLSSKSIKNDVSNESIHTKYSKINSKSNNKPSVVKINNKSTKKEIKTKANMLSKESSCGTFIGNAESDQNSEFNNNKKGVKSKQNATHLIKDEPVDIYKIQQDLLAAALKSINKSSKSKTIKIPDKAVKNKNYKEPNGEANKNRKEKMSKLTHESKKQINSVLQSKTKTSTPNQALSQPCTSQDISTSCKVKSVEKPKTLILHKTNRRSSTFKTVKRKSLKQGAKLDIGKIQQKLLAAALKKINSTSVKNKKSVKLELNEDNNDKTTKIKKLIKNENAKCVEKVKKKSKTVSENKLKSMLDPIDDCTAKLLAAELKKRKKGLKTKKEEGT